jgi:hypothetical protein
LGSQFLWQLDATLQKQGFLHGPHWGLADAALAPFVRHFAHVDPAWFSAQAWAALREWLGGRMEHGLPVGSQAIKNVHYEATLAIDVSDIRRDKTGQIMIRVDDLARRDLRDAIAKRATDAKVALPELDQLVTDALAVTDVAARERMISSAVKAAQTVPSGDVFGRSAPGGVDAPESVSDARAKCEPEVRAEFPSYADNEVRATALRRAQKRWPHLFESPAR